MSDGELTNADLQQRAVRGWLWTVVSIGVSLPVTVVTNAFVARFLGASKYGEFSFYLALLTIGMTIANFGLQSGVVQWGASFEAMGRQRDTNILLSKGLGFYLLVEAPILVALVLVISNGAETAVELMLVAGIVATMYFTPSAVALTVASRVDQQAKLGMIGGVIVQAASVVAAMATRDAIWVFAGRLVVGGALGAAHLIYLDGPRRRATLLPRLPRGFGQGFWRFSMLSGLAMLISTLVFSRSEIFVLQLLDMATVLGVFSLAFGVATQVTAPVDGLLGPLLPALAGVLARDPSAGRVALLRGTRLSSLGATAVLTLAVPLIYPLIPLVYGASFSRAAWPFVVLSITSCLQTSVQTVNAIVMGRRRSGLLLRANVLALTVNVVTAFAFIPTLGLVGAVLANVLSQVAGLVLLVRVELVTSAASWREMGGALSIFWVGMACTLGSITLTTLVTDDLPAEAVVRVPLSVGSALVAAMLAATLFRVCRVRLPPGDTNVIATSFPPWLWRLTGPALRLAGLSPRERGPAAGAT